MHATERMSAHGDAKRNNLSTAHLQGAGIERLPTRVPTLGDPLIPRDNSVEFQFDIRLACYPDEKRTARAKHVIGRTARSFDGRKYPRFRDEFVHRKVS